MKIEIEVVRFDGPLLFLYENRPFGTLPATLLDWDRNEQAIAVISKEGGTETILFTYYSDEPPPPDPEPIFRHTRSGKPVYDTNLSSSDFKEGDVISFMLRDPLMQAFVEYIRRNEMK